MKTKILLAFIMFGFVLSLPIKAEVHTFNGDLLPIKNTLTDIYDKTSAQQKLSKSERKELNNIRAYVDAHKKEGDTNLIPIYYKLGNIYKSLNNKEDAIYCYRTIMKYQPHSQFAKKALVNLKYYGETFQDENGRTRVIPKEDED
jgi:hypothetical protein